METARPDVLILLPWDPSYRRLYEQLLLERHPDLSVRTVGSLAEARSAITEADVFMAFGAALTQDIFGGARRLKWVHAFGTGLDGIVDQQGLRPEVIVTSTRGIHGPPLSEMAILMMLALVRDLPRSVRAQDKHVWERFRARLLYRKTAAIVGVGLIAQDLAPRLKALGMKVIGVTRSPRDLQGFDRFAPRDRLAEAVRDCDFVILLLPHEEATRRLFDRGALEAMKPGSYLVNIARGGILDEEALIDCLKSGHLAGAALDAVQQEPLPADHPLWGAPNLLLTPHLGGFYDEYAYDSIDQIDANMKKFRAGAFNQMMNREPRG